MRPTIVIRPAEPADAVPIAALENRCFGADEAFSLRELRYLIGRAQGACYVAVGGEQVMGYISLLTRRNARNLRIYSVAVDLDARGLGVGQKLIDAAKQRAKEHALSEITLEVRTDNEAAIALYRRNGFCPQRRLLAYYPDGTDAHRMVLSMDEKGEIGHRGDKNTE